MINIIDDDITDIMTLDLDDLRENERFEAKRCEGKLTSEFWPTYSAFANTFGGDIALGLKEDPNNRRRLIAVGVGDTDKILNELWTQVNNPQKVSVNLLSEGDVRIEDVDGRNVIIVHVPRAERQKRPVFINGNMNSGTYRRNGEGDYHCSVTEIAEMLHDSRDEPMDSSLCSKVLLRDLEKETVGAYRRMMSNRVPSHPWNKEPDDEFLRLIGAAGYGDDGELRPTVAGVLMFGRDYSIVRELPRYMLDYLEERIREGVRRGEFTQEEALGLMRPILLAAQKAGRADLMQLAAGQGAPLATAAPAASIVQRLESELDELLGESPFA